jgi:MoxR-like ATPase
MGVVWIEGWGAIISELNIPQGELKAVNKAWGTASSWIGFLQPQLQRQFGTASKLMVLLLAGDPPRLLTFLARAFPEKVPEKNIRAFVEWVEQTDFHDEVSACLAAHSSSLELAPRVRASLMKASLLMTPPDKAPPPAPTDRAALVVPLNLVLEGVPGTGKTHKIKDLVHTLGIAAEGDGNGRGEWAATLHPATSYEDFVEGLRPALSQTRGDEARGGTPEARHPKVTGHSGKEPTWFFKPCNDTTGAFAVRDGFFLRACTEAARDGARWFVVLLDEVNRCNIPKVLGDLLTTLEPSKRARWNSNTRSWDVSQSQTVTLPYSQRVFFVPDNLVVVATMNTSDRSVAGMDAALRRRFAFQRAWPLGFDPGDDARSRSQLVADKLKQDGLPVSDLMKVTIKAWVALNEVLLREVGPDGMLGHSYLFDLGKALGRPAEHQWFRAGDDSTTIRYYWNHYMLPQLVDILETANMFQRVELGDASPYFAPIEQLGTPIVGVLGDSHLQRRIRIELEEPRSAVARVEV